MNGGLHAGCRFRQFGSFFRVVKADERSDGTDRERNSAMARLPKLARLRNLAISLVLGASAAGCAHGNWTYARLSLFHCDECDDFPTPGYGPGYSMMPGTYAGQTPQDSHQANQRALAPPGEPVGPGTPSTPPTPPAAGPAQGAPAAPATAPGQDVSTAPNAGPTTSLDTTPNQTESELPPLPGTTRNDPQTPVASPSSAETVR
jgi:hypothetical protein